MNRRIHTCRIDWNGMTIEISYEPSWLNTADPRFATAHLEIRSIVPDRAPLPVTETGYRSHFVAAGEVTAAGGPIAYVRGWLDRASADPAWRDRQEAARQMTLF